MTDQRQIALEQAVRLAQHGYHLTPVTLRRKADGRKHADFHLPWKTDPAASCDPQQVTAWWVDLPDTSFAVVCAPSGVEGVDLDVKPADGIDASAWWTRRRLPSGSLIVETLSGGLHHLWRRRTAGLTLPNRAGHVIDGVDTRGEGGVFFAAGSYVVGEAGNYTLISPLRYAPDLDETPKVVLDLFAAAPAKARPADGSITTHEVSWMHGQLSAQLLKVAEHGRGGGFRHVVLGAAMVAGRVAEAGQLTHAEAVRQLHAAVTHCWGRVDDEDERWIRDGMADGPARERWRDALFGLTAPQLPPRPKPPTGPPTQAQLVGMLRRVLASDGDERIRLTRWATGKLCGYADAGQLDPVYVGNVVEQLRQAAGGGSR